MKKTLFTCLIILVSMFYMKNNVFAAYTEGGGYEINSIEEAKEEFAGKATVDKSAKKITLTSDIEFKSPNCSDCEEYDMLNFIGDYVLDLNGHTIKVYDFYIEGSLTINDSRGNGQIDANSLWVNSDSTLTINNGKFHTDRIETRIEEVWDGEKLVEKEQVIDIVTEIINEGTLIINNGEVEGITENKEEASLTITGGNLSMLLNLGVLTINNGNINLIDNSGTATIHNGTIQSIWNFGNILIENGNFVDISQEGIAEIKGGTFTAKRICDVVDGEELCNNYYSQFNIDSETKITGGVFKTTNLDFVLKLITYNEYIGDPNRISEIVGEGYLPVYTIYEANDNDVFYRTFKILRDDTTLEELMNKIAPNGILTVNSAKPKSDIKLDSMLTTIVADMGIPEGYQVQVGNGDEQFNPEKGGIFISKITGETLRKEVKIVYNEPSKSIISNITPMVNKISEKTGEDSNEKNAFILSDLYLINYLKNRKDDSVNYSTALNFTKDLIKLTNGSNITYKFDYRKGSGTDLWTFKGGFAIIYYNGTAIDVTEIGLTNNHVLYVPSDTLDKDEARIEAALKRIREYLGTTDGIKIEVGGTLESLNNEAYKWNDFDFIDEKTSGTNYYNITINDRTYKFAICKKENLETPVYMTNDIASNITIKSNSSELPLDTAISVKSVENNTIEKALGTKEYTAFDISLYSNAKETKITKLENGNFEVSIPVPEDLKNKDIEVYYVNENGEKEEHSAKVENGYVVFETDHFSTYALVDSANINNIEVPKTGDNILVYLIITILSIVGIVFISKQIKK